MKYEESGVFVYNLSVLRLISYKQKEAAIGGVLQKNVFLKISQNSQEKAFVGVSATPTQVFSCEFCEILGVTASEYIRNE